MRQRAHALAHRALAQPLLLQKPVHARFDLRILFEAHLVHVRRGHPGRGADAQRPCIIGVAILELPYARIVRRGFRGGVERVELARDRGIDLPGYDLRRHGFIIARNALRLGAARDGSDQPRLRRRNGARARHLADGRLQDEIGGADADADIVLHAGGFLIQHGGKGVQAGKIGVRVRLGVDLVLTVEEFSDADEAAGFLAHNVGRRGFAHRTGERVVAERKARRIPPKCERVADDILVQRVFRRKLRDGNGVKPGDPVRAHLVRGFDGGPGGIAEFRLEARTRTLVEAQIGRAFRLPGQKDIAQIVKHSGEIALLRGCCDGRRAERNDARSGASQKRTTIEFHDLSPVFRSG